jgi:hypothetical protein
MNGRAKLVCSRYDRASDSFIATGDVIAPAPPPPRC